MVDLVMALRLKQLVDHSLGRLHPELKADLLQVNSHSLELVQLAYLGQQQDLV